MTPKNVVVILVDNSKIVTSSRKGCYGTEEELKYNSKTFK